MSKNSLQQFPRTLRRSYTSTSRSWASTPKAASPTGIQVQTPTQKKPDITRQLVSVRSQLAGSPLFCFEKNLERMTFRKTNSMKFASIKPPKLLADDRSPIAYIDQFYPNGSESKFPNKVSSPGDFDFKKSLYANKDRNKARRLELKKNALSDKHLDNYPIKIKTMAFTLVWKSIITTGSIPSKMEGATMAKIGDLHYLYGGESNMKYTGIHIYNFNKQEWSKTITFNAPMGKVGHSAASYRKKMFVYGGWIYQNFRKECSRRVHILNTRDMTWRETDGRGSIPIGRRHHASTSIGTSMLIYGGIDVNSDYLGDLHVFDMENYKWTSPQFTYTQFPPLRTHTSFTAVFPTDILNDPRIDVFNASDRAGLFEIDYGFYMFGGKSGTGEALNDLWVLKFTTQGCLWVLVDAQDPPEPRFSHTATHLNGLLFVFGGADHAVFGLDVYYVEKKVWKNPRIVGDLPLNRWGHCASIEEKKVLILGGQNQNDWFNEEVYVLETDQVLVQK